MTAHAYESTNLLNMTVALRQDVSSELGNIPAHIIRVWSQVQSASCLVTLEYERPTRYRNQLIRHIDALLSDLYEVPVASASGECMHASCAGCLLTSPAA